MGAENTKDSRSYWEELIVNSNNDGTYNVETYFNEYMRSTSLDENVINQASSVGDWEKWVFSPSGDNDGKICVKSNYWGVYLSSN